MIEGNELDGVAPDAAGRVCRVDRELRALEGRLAVGASAAGQRKRDTELELTFVGAGAPDAPPAAVLAPEVSAAEPCSSTPRTPGC
jgi:hypothetical protein